MNIRKIQRKLKQQNQGMPNLNDMKDKEYHQKGTLYNVMLESFIIEDYKLWSLELAVKFCQEHHIRTLQDCLQYSSMRSYPDNFDCTWDEYIQDCIKKYEKKEISKSTK